MLTIATGAASQDVLQGARHVLFVEGTKDGLDVTVLHELLTPRLRVEPLGASFSVRSVASALHAFHPQYWFIIDRDHWDDAAVNISWTKFPDPAADNLLIWRRKELESYFLEPSWACASKYLKSSNITSTHIEDWLTDEAQKILWLEAANRVLIAKRDKIKQCTGNILALGDVVGCTKDQVIQKLVSSPMLESITSATAKETAESKIKADFDDEVASLSGGGEVLSWSAGRWRELMSAKAMFRSMVNRWFVVPDLSKGGKFRLSGRDAERALAVDLLKNHQDNLPADFSELKVILDKAISDMTQGNGGKTP